jgi:hypothetical protein
MVHVSLRLGITLLVIVTSRVEAVVKGWSATFYQTNDIHIKVPKAEADIIESSRSTTVYEELNVKRGRGECCWPGAPAVEGFFAQFQGFLDVPKHGEYAFRMKSDDGAILFIDGEVVSLILLSWISSPSP